MKAVMLAAGVGSRLNGGTEAPPKALLGFGGKTLLERHVDTLRGLGVDGLTLVVGYRADDIQAEIRRIGADGFVTARHNADFRLGSVVSLWQAEDVLACGDDVLFMDADVLYAPSLIERLVRSPHADCIPFDREFEPGDEPVKLCLAKGKPVDFGKIVDAPHDQVGEWPGFLRLSSERGRAARAATERCMAAGETGLSADDVIRDVVLTAPAGGFSVVDITGIPWIEIDFPADVARAETVILPRILELEGALLGAGRSNKN